MKLIYTLGIMVIVGAFGYSFWSNKNQANQDNNLKVGNNMASIEDLTRGDVKMIIAYIRELQRANGIN
jgi:predicted negative regulator of RcsB-dependent stress response